MQLNNSFGVCLLIHCFLQVDTYEFEKFVNQTVGSDFDLKKIIETFQATNLQFHYDNENAENVIHFQTVTSTFFNYDSGRKIARPKTGRRALNVVSLDSPEKFSAFVETATNVRENDAAVFLINNFDESDFWSNSRLSSFETVFLLRPNDTLERICFFCGNNTGQITEFEEPAGDFKNFKGHFLRVVFVEYFPFVWCENLVKVGPRKVCADSRGPEFQLLQILSEKLNFEFDVEVLTDYGVLIEAIRRRKFDVGLGGISRTLSRAKKVSFTAVFNHDGYHFLYVCRRNFLQDLYAFVHPFSLAVWLSLSATILITTFSLYCVMKVGLVSKISYSRSVWLSLVSMMEQNTGVARTIKLQASVMIMFANWWLGCIILNIAYKSMLISDLINPPHKEPHNLVQLLADGFNIVTNLNYKDVFLEIFNVSGGAVEEAAKRILTKDNVCDEFLHAMANQAAVFDEYSSLQYETRRDCYFLKEKNAIYDIENPPNVRITSENFFISNHAWPMQLQVPYERTFNSIIGRVISVGLLQKWKRDATDLMAKGFFATSRDNAEENYDLNVTIQTLASPFIIYLIGHCVAIVAFVFEIVYYKSRK